MGLGRGSLSVVDQLVVQGAIASSFSLCYGGMDDDGGAMILGAVPPLDEMVFTPSNPTRSNYCNVDLEEIWVQGEPLPVKPDVFDGRYGTILDSGTTFAYLPENAFNVFKNAFVRGVSKDLGEINGPEENVKDICYSGAGTDPDKLGSYFPSIDLVFGEEKMVSLAAENYLFRHPSHPGAYCLGIFQNEDSTTILGGIVTRNMLVTYDRENDQIGFLRTKCTGLWRTMFADSPDTGNEWTRPPIPVASSPRSSASSRSSARAPSPNSSQPPPPVKKNHSDNAGDVIPLKDVRTSDALPLLFSAPLFSGRSSRHVSLLHVPSIVILIVRTFWE